MKAIEISTLKKLICDLIKDENKTTLSRPEDVRHKIGNFLTQFEIELNSKIKENAKDIDKLIEEAEDQKKRAALKAAEQAPQDSQIDDPSIK